MNESHIENSMNEGEDDYQSSNHENQDYYLKHSSIELFNKNHDTSKDGKNI